MFIKLWDCRLVLSAVYELRWYSVKGVFVREDLSLEKPTASCVAHGVASDNLDIFTYQSTTRFEFC